MEAILISVVRSDGEILGQFYLGEGDHLIGREDHCTVQITADQVSAQHARLSISPLGIFIEDLGSTSGTFLDGVPISGKIRVNPSQRLQVSDLFIDVPQKSDEMIYVSRDGQQFGPITAAQTQSFLADGTLLQTDMAWTEGSAQWVPITSIAQASIPSSPAPLTIGGPAKPEGMIKKILFKFMARGQHKDESIVGVVLDNIGRIATVMAIISFLIGGVYWYIGKVNRDKYKRKVLAAAQGEAQMILDSSMRGNARSTVIAVRNFAKGGGSKGYYDQSPAFADGSLIKQNKELRGEFINKLVEQSADDPSAKYSLVLYILRDPWIIYFLSETPQEGFSSPSGELFDRYREKIKTWLKESAEAGNLDAQYLQVLFEMLAEEIEGAKNFVEIRRLLGKPPRQLIFAWNDSSRQKYYERIKKIADNGHGDACGAMALFYFNSLLKNPGIITDEKGKVTEIIIPEAVKTAGIKIGDILSVVNHSPPSETLLSLKTLVELNREINRPTWNAGNRLEVRIKNRGNPEQSVYVTLWNGEWKKFKMFSLPYSQLIELQHKYSWQGAHRGSLFSMTCLANIYGGGYGSKYLGMDPEIECILAHKWMHQYELFMMPKKRAHQSFDEWSQGYGYANPDLFPDAIIKGFGNLRPEFISYFSLAYFPVYAEYKNPVPSLNFFSAKNWKDRGNPIPISESQKETAREKQKLFVPNLLLAMSGDKNAQMEMALQLHGAGEYAKSYKWMLLAKKSGHPFAELMIDGFDWDRKHKEEGEKMAAGINPKKTPYPYSW
tara:strand:+ start:5484 stop:7817 length:2334 start_codon:yes stop_codon:yes gene_type:complete